jgi:hypothetical protein
MSEYPQSGLHPDADSLNAFIEGVQPEHERLECLAHLAECPLCREVVYLAQESEPAQPLPVRAAGNSFWKRWVTPVPVLTAAAVTALLVLSVAVYRQYRPAANAPELVASATPRAAELKPPVEPTPQPEALSSARPKAAGGLQKVVQPPETPTTNTVTGTPAISLAATAPPYIPPSVPLPSTPLTPAGPAIAANGALISGPSGIAGTITGPPEE